jgi:hypothetical protein
VIEHESESRMKLIYICLQYVYGCFSDDFTQSDEDQGVDHSIERLNNGCDLVHKKLDGKEQLHALDSLAEGSPLKDVLSAKVTSSGSAELGEQGKGFT